MTTKQTSESIEVSMLLTFVGGFLEIYSFLLKGHVFATTITGNIVLMLFNLSNKNYPLIIRYIFPILGFCLGTIISIKIRQNFSDKLLHWRLYVIPLKILLIILIYLLKDKRFIIIDICLISMLSALQIQTFTKIKKRVYMSTMCTGNTRKFIQNLVYKDYETAKIFACVICSFASGVIFGSIIIDKIKEISILLMIIPILIVAYLVHKN